MSDKYKKIFIVASSSFACLFMYVVEQYIGCSYLVKTSVKIFLFAGIPFAFTLLSGTGSIRNSLGIEHIKFKDLKAGIVLGISVFAVIISAYYLLHHLVDLNSIRNELETKLKITAGTFFIVGLYITFVNSFIEEFFFRGYIFLGIHETGLRKTAAIISSLYFGLYHISIFRTWFSLTLTVTVLAGLVTAGLIFNHLNIRSRNFLNSWIVHIFADSAIILIGFRMFYF